MDVSIVIVNWNTRDFLRNCLKSVYAETDGINFEVVVVDNASTDRSGEMIVKELPQVILIQNSQNRGFASANNQGIKVAKGRYILLLNSDALLLNAAIVKTVEFADANPASAVVGCRVLNPDRTLQPTCFMFPSILNMVLSTSYLYKLFPKSKFFGRERMTWWDRNEVCEVDVVTGCFMLVRRKAIEQIGLMDERFFMYGEETDWCYRFKQAGWKVVYAPVAEIIHFGGQSTLKVQESMFVERRLSTLKFIYKHYGWLTHKVACLLIIMFFVIRLPIFLIVGLLGRTDRKQARIKLKAYVKGVKKVLTALASSLGRKRPA